MSLEPARAAQVGVDARGVIDFLDAVERDRLGLHGIAMARHGRTFAEGYWAPYSANRFQLVYSCSKSFTASAVGLLVAEGRLALEDRVVDRLPWETLATQRDSLHSHWNRVRIEHCLSMTLGHDDDAWGRATQGAFDGRGQPADLDWLDLILQVPPDHEPGTVFSYNQVCTYLLSRIVEHVAGEPLLAYLRPRLLDPLGIGTVGTHTDTAGHALGFTGMHLRPTDLLALAQTYLDEGRFAGRQVLAPDWVSRARAPYGPPNRDPNGDPDWRRGYGFSFWGCEFGYRGDGAFGQYVLVLPEHDVAIGMTSEIARMQSQLDAVWAHIVPAVGREPTPGADDELARRLSELQFLPSMPLCSVTREGPVCATRSLGIDDAPGEFGSDGELPESLTAATVLAADQPGHWVLTLTEQSQHGGIEHRVDVGERDWVESRLTWPAAGLSLPVLARGGWVDADLFEADVLVIETPHRFRVRVERQAATVTLRWRYTPLNGSHPAYLCLRP